MKSFAIEQRKNALQRRSSSNASSLHAGSVDCDEQPPGGLVAPHEELGQLYDFPSVPHFTANNTGHDREEGESVEIIIPRQEGKLSALFGIKLIQNGNYVTVEHLFHDCPAEKAGLMPLDAILQIEGEDIHTLAQARMLLETQKEVYLVVQRRILAVKPSSKVHRI